MLNSRVFLSLFLATGLFALNNLAVLSGWFATPDGYVHLMHVDASDNSIYESWIRSSESRLLHPNFQAPWQTEPAVFKPFLFMIARLSRLAGVSLDLGWFIAHLGLYILTAYALFAAVWQFMKTARQRWAALGVMLLTVPVPSLLVLPSLLFPLDRLGVPPLPGVGFFVWFSSDGFLHGISGSILVTYGTAATVAAFAFLAAYMQTEKWRYLAGAGVAVLLCGLVHPYEPILILTAGSLALLIWRGANWRRSFTEVAALGFSGALGMVPMAGIALQNPWVRDAAGITRWSPPNPVILLVILGVPAILACLLFIARRRMASATDLLLQCWIVCALVGIYIPFIPWTQHFLDGLHYGVAMLLVRQLVQTPLAEQAWRQYRGPVTASVAVLVVLSLGAYPAYYWQAWKDGRLPEPERLFSSVIPRDDLSTRDWLAENAAHTDLVLAPLKQATWFSTVPMHSFAGNKLFSITFDVQSQLSNDFYAGRMDREEAERFLSAYGIRWVVLPKGSPARSLLEYANERVQFGNWTVLEIKGNTMKPYPGISR